MHAATTICLQLHVHQGIIIVYIYTSLPFSLLSLPLLRESDELKPTLLKLKTMARGDGTPLMIIRIIAAGNYKTFGMLLLHDENGEEVGHIERIYRLSGIEDVIEEILKKWLTSGAPTCTYQHLIECLKQSGLSALADEIVITVTEGTVLQALSAHFCITNY